uniref:Uncharacterized protein n=1 Tax=Lepeophtheirus salmonis TaxID=72036 RepID=A0A0K2VJH5_LEPSM
MESTTSPPPSAHELFQVYMLIVGLSKVIESGGVSLMSNNSWHDAQLIFSTKKNQYIRQESREHYCLP